MLAEGYDRLDRRMSMMSKPELRNSLIQRRQRGLSSPPLKESIKEEHWRSYSAAGQLSGLMSKGNWKAGYTSEDTWVPPSFPAENSPLRKDSIYAPDVSALIASQMAPTPAETTLPKAKKLTAGGLMILLYFWTCGGPFGVETAVGAGGALLTWVSMLLASIFWCVPQAIMAAELSLMIDENGGNIIWVKRAFGDFLAFVNAHCYLVLNLSTLSLLVQLFVNYIPNSTEWGEGVIWGLRSGFVLLVFLLNMVGVDVLARLSTMFLIFIFSPFLAQMIAIVVFRVPIRFSNLLWIPPTEEIDFGTLISTVVWSFGGFDSVGSVAGEVKGGKKTFLLGVMGSFPLTLLNYILPIMLDFIIDKDITNWESGYFTAIVFKHFPTWLGVWITVASGLSNFAQCASGVAPVAWNVWAMARGEETGGVSYLPEILGWEWQRRPGGTIRPVAGIAFTSIAILAISAIPYYLLLQIYLLLRIFNLLLEYAALIWLKKKEPDTPRPYKVPGGLLGAIILVIPFVVISVVSIYFAEREAILAGGVVLVAVTCLWPTLLLFKNLTSHCK